MENFVKARNPFKTKRVLSSDGFAERFLAVLHKEGVTNRALSERLSASDATIGRWLKCKQGKNEPTLWALTEIINEFELDPVWFLFGEVYEADAWFLDEEKILENPDEAVAALTDMVEACIEKLRIATTAARQRTQLSDES